MTVVISRIAADVCLWRRNEKVLRYNHLELKVNMMRLSVLTGAGNVNKVEYITSDL